MLPTTGTRVRAAAKKTILFAPCSLAPWLNIEIRGVRGGRGQCKRVGRRNVFFADTGLNILCPCGLSRRNFGRRPRPKGAQGSVVLACLPSPAHKHDVNLKVEVFAQEENTQIFIVSLSYVSFAWASHLSMLPGTRHVAWHPRRAVAQDSAMRPMMRSRRRCGAMARTRVCGGRSQD